jgi:hypothetical protein
MLALQGFVAAWLCSYKVLANIQLAPGQKYAAPFLHLLATIDWAGAALGLVFLVMAFLVPPWHVIDDIAAWLGRHVRMVAVGTAVGLAAMSVVAHQAYPLTMDEYAHQFQSQVFARGRLAGQWPPAIAPLLVAPQSIDWFIVLSKVTGEARSLYWPGLAVLMTPFTFLGIPWACNPVLSGCAILLLAAVTRRAFGERAVGWVILFTLSSPVFAAYGSSFYPMTAHFTLNLLYAFLLLSPTLPRVAGAGLVGGFALTLHNPFPHFVFSLPWLAWLGLRADRWTRLPLIGLCYAAVFLPIDVGWRRVEQSIRSDRPATVFAAEAAEDARLMAEHPAADAESSPAVPQLPASPTGVSAILEPLRGYFSTLKVPGFMDFLSGRVVALLRVVAWDAPGLVVLACWGFWRNRQSTATRLFALSGLSTFLGYALIEMGGGHGWGYRYFFSAWSCLPFLAAGLAANHSPNEPAKPSGESNRGASAAEILRATGLAAVLSLAICLPVRLWQIHAFITDHRGQMPPLPPASVVGQGEVVRFLDSGQGWFRHDLIRNDPFFERGPYVFVSQGIEQDKLVVEKLAEAAGMQARMSHTDYRGSTWILQPVPRKDLGP